LLIYAKEPEPQTILDSIPEGLFVITLYNKIDLVNKEPEIQNTETGTQIYLSIKTGAGMDLLIQHLKQSVGYNDATENIFIARTRHLEALNTSHQLIQNALHQLQTTQASELVAEDLRLAQQALAEITGEFTSDDLLGKIFSSFCIGK